MKHNRIFYLTYILFALLSLYGVFLINIYFLLFSNIAITASFIILFKVQGNLTSKKSANILILNFISFGICEFFGFLRENIYFFLICFLFGLITAVSSFIFLDTDSNWQNKALSHKKKLYIVLILVVSFYAVEKLVLPSYPDMVFFPASITIILLIVTFAITFFRETNNESYYFITMACAFFIICLVFSAKIPLKHPPRNALLLMNYTLYLTAKFFWVQGCIWSLKSSS